MSDKHIENLERVYDAMSTVRSDLGSARIRLNQRERDDDDNPVNKAYRATSAYWRLLRETIDDLRNITPSKDAYWQGDSSGPGFPYDH